MPLHLYGVISSYVSFFLMFSLYFHLHLLKIEFNHIKFNINKNMHTYYDFVLLKTQNVSFFLCCCFKYI